MNRPGRPSVPERNHFIELDEITPAKGGCKISLEDDEPSRKRITRSRSLPPSSAVGHKRARYSEGIDEQLSTRYFLDLLCPGITSILPSLRALGERLLDDHARLCYKKNASGLREQQNSGGRANPLTDVWSSRARPDLNELVFLLCLDETPGPSKSTQMSPMPKYSPTSSRSGPATCHHTRPQRIIVSQGKHPSLALLLKRHDLPQYALRTMLLRILPNGRIRSSIVHNAFITFSSDLLEERRGWRSHDALYHSDSLTKSFSVENTRW
ncbi:uncharacterized protein PITG_09237 [Phytophthora infestans T30-4]|uniref:Uncharacterized protein n=1 Tax=Phytophthora infestans (strain T30-4) TaxID=403677 RepID=D0NB74_PHYIT|nr:uncharacterized protein PITG_09237 [Phytophthora infestans T30-4]EEY55303.1 hypothetical protein PITG_09237 [Phytophthora infestans T30-4]|eukprot:XP_002903527.1 hypothetical protein PITG_09237 [Phytophthora infestans T30-4]